MADKPGCGPGADGKKGAKGEPGIQGSAGQKGQQGDKGDSGTSQLASHMNLWQAKHDKSSMSFKSYIEFQ